MKTLTQYIVEKLIINRNYKNVDDIESLFDNIEFEHDEDEELETSDDIYVYFILLVETISFIGYIIYNKKTKNKE